MSGETDSGSVSGLPAASKLSRNDTTGQETLFALYDQMMGGVHRADVLARITDVVAGTMNAERATIYVVIRETRELESLAAGGLSSALIRVPINARSLAGYCASTGNAFAVPDAYGDLTRIDPRLGFDSTWDERHDFRTRDVVCVPITFKGEILGVLQVINRRGKAFDEEDIPPFFSLARMVGHALHYSLLYEELETLRRLKKEKAEFMRIMTHELKSPLAAARMLADAVVYAGETAPETVSILERLRRRLDDMLLMIGDILEFSRVNEGEPLGEIAVFDLSPLTEDIRGDFLEQAEAGGLDLSVACADGPVPVRLDRQGYRLVMSNLVSNAIKYTAEGAVRVSLRRNDSWAVLEVADTGMGIPQEDQPRLFQEFFRASNARKSEVQGTGVGLAGVKGIVERFDGELALQSKEGEGTTVTVRFPLHRGEG